MAVSVKNDEVLYKFMCYVPLTIQHKNYVWTVEYNCAYIQINLTMIMDEISDDNVLRILFAASAYYHL